MGKANQCQIVLGTTSIEITREPVNVSSPELLPKIAISGVYPVKINTKPASPNDQYWSYRFNSMIMVDIVMNDGESHFNFDLQEVTNQPTWTPNLAGQQKCIDDINAWLA